MMSTLFPALPTILSAAEAATPDAEWQAAEALFKERRWAEAERAFAAYARRFPPPPRKAEALAMANDVAAGVSKCREGCAWFRFCGGGAPGNKYFENGSFDSTQTLFCRLHRQALADVVLTKTRRPDGRVVRVA